MCTVRQLVGKSYVTCVILEAAPPPSAWSLDDIRDVTGRVTGDADPPPRRARLRVDLPEVLAASGNATEPNCLTAGESAHHIGSASFRSPACAGAAYEKVRNMRHRGV